MAAPRWNAYFLRRLLLLVTLSAALPVAADQDIFTAKYKGEYSGWDVELTRTLSKDDNGVYKFRSSAENLFASIAETSEFTLQEHTLLPQSYIYKRSIFGRKKTETIDFDYKKSVATYRENKDDKIYTHSLEKPLSDPALYQLLIQHDFKDGADQADYHLVKRSRVKHYAFKRVADDTVKLGKKEYPAIVVERVDDDNNKRTRAWLVPALDYSLGKLEHSDDGDTYTITLSEYRVDHSALKEFHSAL